MSAVWQEAASCLPMRWADVDVVLALEQRCYPFPWTRGNFEDSLRHGHRAELLRNVHGELIGYALALPVVDEVHLLNLTVAPAHEGRGHARRLLDRLRTWATEGGMASIWLEVRESNARARRLYARYGFAEVGRRRSYYPAPEGRREDAVVMQLSLPAGVGTQAGAEDG